MERSFESAVRAVALGHAVADALGVPVEFMGRDELDAAPVTGMTGYGTYAVPAGSFSDDTSMALAALDSLSSGRLDYADVMARFCDWYYEDAYTPTGELFDVGCTCARAIENYFEKKVPLWECAPRAERDNGNGGLMRIYPFVLFAWGRGMGEGEMTDVIRRATALTHAHERACVASTVYAFVLRALLEHPCKEAVRSALTFLNGSLAQNVEYAHLTPLLAPALSASAREEIASGGYVIDTLRAALWCLLTTESYRECVLRAVNLGDDTDTTAAVAGALAGALYGEEAIPEEWLGAMQNKELLMTLIDSFSHGIRTKE